MFQTDTIHTAKVRNVVFRDIFLYNIRTPFQLMCYGNNYEHSYYPGAPMPIQGNIVLDNINMLSDNSQPMISISRSSPCDFITITNSKFKNNGIRFEHNVDFDRYPPTYINITNSVFTHSGENLLIENKSPDKEIYLKTNGNLIVGKDFSVKMETGKGKIYIDSDLTDFKGK